MKEYLSHIRDNIRHNIKKIAIALQAHPSCKKKRINIQNTVKINAYFKRFIYISMTKM